MSPSLASYAESYANAKRESFEMSAQDTTYFVAQIIRSICLISLFTILFFIALIDSNKSVEQSTQWLHKLNEFAKFDFGAASTFNLGYLFAWAGLVAEKRLRARQS